MAKVDIQYSCGCGFLTRDLEAAGTHCDTQYHDLTVSGIVKSSTRTSVHQAIVRHPEYKDHHGDKEQPVRKKIIAAPVAPAPEVREKEIHADFNSLKARLGRKV